MITLSLVVSFSLANLANQDFPTGKNDRAGSSQSDVWSRVERSIAILTDDSKNLNGVAALIDPQGYFIAHSSSIHGQKVTAVISGNEKITLGVVSEDKRTGYTLLKSESWREISRSPLNVSKVDGARIGVTIITTSGPVTGYLSNRNQVGVLEENSQIIPLTETQFEKPTKPIGASLIFDNAGDLMGIVGGILHNPVSPESRDNAVARFGPEGQTITYSISPKVLERVIKGFKSASRKVEHPTIGLYFKLNKEGVVVDSLAEGGPSEKAGMEEGDVIKKIDAEDILSPTQLARILFELSPGSSIEVTYLRDGQEKKVTLEVGVQSQLED